CFAPVSHPARRSVVLCVATLVLRASSSTRFPYTTLFRSLARYVHGTTRTYMPEMNPMMIYRLDRFGRGGHHRPFNDAGFAGIRIMEAHENYTQQHQDIRVEDGIAYGDVLEHVNFDYGKKLTAVNAIALASLAWAP